MVSGIERIGRTFNDLRMERAALITYAMGFYPDRQRSIQVVRAMLEGGADAIEIGVPFSDPVMDGPVIQEAGEAALLEGATPTGVMELVSELRDLTDRPLLIMTYYNTVFRMGHAEFVSQAASCGVDGLIVPDLPTEEMDGLKRECDAAGVAVVPFCSMTTTPERIEAAGSATTGFLYCVSRLGTTGARDELPTELPGFLARVREHTTCPIAAGVGVSTPEQCASVGALADGVIVGSALVDRVKDSADDYATVSQLVTSMSRALNNTPAAKC